MNKPQIIAIGGGTFATERGKSILCDYFVRQTGKRNPSVCFMGTATGDADVHIVRWYSVFSKLSCKPTHLSLFHPPKDLAAFVLAQDAIYVGGGNTKSLMALWREWKLDRILRKAWRQGVVLGGVSAGSICWFEQGLTDSVPGKLTVLPCLGLLGGSNCPHYDGEPKRRPAYERLIRQGKMKAGLAADNGVALHFIGKKLAHVVSSLPDVAAYRVRRHGKGAREDKIAPEYLGKK